ncbi:MAG: septal ring lytic transglycosylase RlpA family protein [Gammaproteobacteria bacterium]
MNYLAIKVNTRLMRRVAYLLLAAGLVACSSQRMFEPRDAAPANPRDVSSVQNAVPRVEPRSRYGNPASYVVYGKRYYTLNSSAGYRETGHASWYGTKFHGRRTSSGEPYDMYAMSAAHKTLPIPCYVEVTNLANGRTVIVRVNDRGPFHDGRIIDLSYAAASKLGMLGKGTARVAVRVITPGAPAVQPEPEPLQAFIPPAPAGTAPLFLQVGAFSNRDNAERLRRSLEGQGVGAVRIVEADTGNGMFFKVQVGPLADTGEADRVAQVLKPLGINAARTRID